MTTLRERLDDMAIAPRLLKREIESWAYGEEGECVKCGGDGRLCFEGYAPYACPTCHGTGKTREPGLVERFEAAMWALEDPEDRIPGDDSPLLLPLDLVLAALRQELDEVK